MPTRKFLFNWFFLIVFSLLTVPGWPLHILLENAGWVPAGAFSFGSIKNPTQRDFFSLFGQTNQENGKRPGTVHHPDSCIFCAFFHALSCVVFVLQAVAALILINLFMDIYAPTYLIMEHVSVACARAPPF